MLFLKRDADKVLKTMLERVKSETNITVTTPGSVARTLFEIIADEIGLDYAYFDTNMQQLFISTASGDALDQIGAMFGVTRTTTTTSVLSNSGSVYFYLNTSADHVAGTADKTAASPITIPSGTLLSTNSINTTAYNPVTWETTVSTTIQTGAYLAYTTVTPVQSEQKTIGEGTLVFHNLDSTDFPDVYVYNKRDLDTNVSIESDGNYRYRIGKAVLGLGTGNATALRLAGLSISGVKDVKILPLAEGVGTVSAIVVVEQPGTGGGTTAFSNAGTAIRSAASVGDLVFIERPTELPVTISGKILLRSGTTTQAMRDAVEQSIIRYLGSLSIGDPIIYSRLIADAMNISPDIREFAIDDGGFTVNGQVVPRTNYRTKEREQVYPQAGGITIL